MCSRQSCGDWMIKNKKANEMRRLCSEYKRDNNLGLAYENFNLMEEMEEMCKRCPKWAVHEWKKHNDKLTTIFLPEFMNRYSFVSSYAWLINSFFAIKGVKWRHGIQLLHVALLTPSQIQFHLVVRCLKNEFKPKNNFVLRTHETLQKTWFDSKWWTQIKIYGRKRK